MTDDEVFGPGATEQVTPGVKVEIPAENDPWEKLKEFLDGIREVAESLKAHRVDVPLIDSAKNEWLVSHGLSGLSKQLWDTDGMAALQGPSPAAGGSLMELAGEASGQIRDGVFDVLFTLVKMAAEIAREELARRHAGDGEPVAAEPRPFSANDPDRR